MKSLQYQNWDLVGENPINLKYLEIYNVFFQLEDKLALNHDNEKQAREQTRTDSIDWKQHSNTGNRKD